MDSFHYDEALVDYQAAYAASHDAAILYNIGQVRRARGEYPEALDAFQAFEREARPELKALVPKLGELLAEIRSKVASLQVAINVAGARIIVRDRIVGTTPMATPIRLNAGRTTIEITAEGYLPYTKELDLPGGGVAVIDAKLETKDSHGILVVRASEGPAAVFIDGKRAGTAPVEQVVGAGSHSVVVRRDGFEDGAGSVVVRPGERRDLDLKLTAKSGITSKWWFWTGVGVVVAGGAATAVVLLSSRKADRGDGFEPNQLGAPLRW